MLSNTFSPATGGSVRKERSKVELAFVDHHIDDRIDLGYPKLMFGYFGIFIQDVAFEVSTPQYFTARFYVFEGGHFGPKYAQQWRFGAIIITKTR